MVLSARSVVLSLCALALTSAWGQDSFVTQPNTIVKSTTTASVNGINASSQAITSLPGYLIGGIRVGIRMDHDYVGDVALLLLPPGVTWPQGLAYQQSSIVTAQAAGAILLVESPGGSFNYSTDLGSGAFGTTYTYLYFTSSSDPLFSNSGSILSAPVQNNLSGTYTPEDDADMAALLGTAANGTWTLVAIDVYPSVDDGTLIAWQLQFYEATSDYTVAVGPDPVPSPFLNGSDVVLAQFTATSTLASELDGLTFELVTQAGSGADLTNLRLFRDLGTEGVFDQADTQLGSTVADFSADASFSFTLDITSPAKKLLLVADVNGSPGDDYQVRIATAGDVLASDAQGATGPSSSQSFPVLGPAIGILDIAVIGINSSHTQGFEAGTPQNYRIDESGPFPTATTSTSTTLAVATSVDPGGARIEIYGSSLPGSVALTPADGTQQLAIDYDHPNNDWLNGAVDFFYDMSALKVAADSVILEFSWAHFGSEQDVEDMVVLSTDGGATWEAIAFRFDFTKTSSVYHQAYVNLTDVLSAHSLSFTDEMVIRFQEKDDFEIDLDGVALDKITVSSDRFAGPQLNQSGTTNFGSAQLNTPSATSPALWTITNPDPIDVRVTAITVTGTHASDFSLDSLPSLPLSLSQGQSLSFEVIFEPTALGTRTATVRIEATSGGPTSNLDIAVTGVGTASVALGSGFSSTPTGNGGNSGGGKSFPNCTLQSSPVGLRIWPVLALLLIVVRGSVLGFRGHRAPKSS